MESFEENRYKEINSAIETHFIEIIDFFKKTIKKSGLSCNLVVIRIGEDLKDNNLVYPIHINMNLKEDKFVMHVFRNGEVITYNDDPNLFPKLDFHLYIKCFPLYIKRMFILNWEYYKKEFLNELASLKKTEHEISLEEEKIINFKI